MSFRRPGIPLGSPQHLVGAGRRVSRFDRYLLSQLLAAVWVFLAWCWSAVYWVNRAVGLFDQLIGDGQSALVFLEFSILTLPNVIRLVLPIRGLRGDGLCGEPADAGKRACGDAGDRVFRLSAGAARACISG